MVQSQSVVHYGFSQMFADISVIIITKNEENDIRRCLESVKDFAEIIVVDSGSTDKTVDICKEYTDKVFYNAWPGFGKQKNHALSHATKKWVLSLDADEWLTSDLKDEILNTVSNTDSKDSFYIPRKSYYCGKLIRFGHWRGDKVLRLFRNGMGQFTNSLVHERLVVKGNIKTLKNYILHNSFVSHEDVLGKMDSYSSLMAKQKFDSGKSSNIFSAVVKGLWAFINSYVLRLGFLDGKEGFLLAFSFAEGTFYKYVKLSLLEDGSKNKAI